MNKKFQGLTPVYLFILMLFPAAASYGQNVPNEETAPAGSATLFQLPPQLPGTNTFFNYTKSFTPMVPLTNSQDVTATSPETDVKVAVTFRNGFNGGLQTIIRNHTNTARKHLVIPADGRVQQDRYDYMPYATAVDYAPFSGAAAQCALYPFAEQKDYYNNLYPDEGYTSFSRTKYVSDAAQRSMVSYAPGKSQVGQGRGVTAKSITNDDAMVRIWTVNSIGQLQSPGFYPADVLYGSISTNVHGVEVTTFKDKEGHVIYQKEYQSNLVIPGAGVSQVFGITYNVYDELGQLRFTIPPAATALISGDTLTQERLDKLCYQYQYNDKGQLTRKKVPGKLPELYVYDKLGRTVLYQDGNLAQDSKKWIFTIYDKKGRSLCSGTWQNAATRQTLQAYFYDNSTFTATDLFYYQKNYELFQQYPSTITGADILSYNYYDDYIQTDPNDYYWGTFAANNLFASERLNSVGAEIPARGFSAMGLPTGSKVKILPAPPAVNTSQTGEWREMVTFYDNKRRPVYTVSRDTDQGQQKHGHAIATQYDFAGRVLSTKHILVNANSSTGSHKEITRNYYDGPSGLLTKTEHKMNTGTWNVLALYTYDELGRVKRKVLGNYGEVRDFSYNIRGQLEGINPLYAMTGNKEGESRSFGEALRYDYGFTTPRYDGKIAGMIWRGSTHKNAYGYRYDPAGRLTTADYRKWESGTISNPYAGWYNNYADYTVSNLTYDLNGNIKTMKQRGMGIVNGSVVPVDMDDLTYSYEADGNKLHHVIENAGTDYGNGDFQNPVGAGNYYDYDPNGNLNLDKNKGIGAVSYNFLNKPVTVTMGTSGNKITYSYDAAGNKVQEISTVSGVSTITDYVGNFVYKNNVLQYALTPEGRTVYTPSQLGLPSFREEFFVKDHLDNVRSVVDVYTYPVQQYLASYEVASANLEGLFFDNMDEVRDDSPSPTPGNTQAGNLNGEVPERRIGTSMLLKVMAGDKVELNVNNYFESYNAEQDQPVSAEDMLGSVVSTLTSGSGGFTGSESHNNKLVEDLFRMGNFGQYNDLLSQNTDPSKPKAYLNYILFDEGMKIVREMSGAFQANGEGTWSAIGTTAPMVVPANGYLAVYLSNSSALGCGACGDVFFDQLVIRMTTGKLKEESHYYPHGLPIGSMGSAASGFTPNRNKYQSNEYKQEQGLNWMDFHNRQYDPQLGRFLSIDPLAAATPAMSPYTGMNNDPVSIVDPLGLQGNNMQAPPFLNYASPIMPMGSRKDYRPGGDGTNGAEEFAKSAAGIVKGMRLGQMFMEASLLGRGTSSIAQGNTGLANNSGGNGYTTSVSIGFDDNGGVEYEVSAPKKVGFFGKMWGSVKNAWNGFGNAVGGVMEGIHNWMNRKLGHEADVRRDKTYDKNGGGIMLTGEDGGYGEGRSVGHADKQPVNVDDMGFMFSHGGSGGDIPAGDIAELIDRANEIYGRFTGGNGIFDFMKPDVNNDTLLFIDGSLQSISIDSIQYLNHPLKDTNGFYEGENVYNRR